MAKQVARRMLIRLLGLAGVTLAVAPHAAYSLPDGAPARRLTGLLADAASARQVGLAYLQADPGEADRERLQKERVGRLGGNPSREEYTSHCRDDFAAGRTVTVNGWVLSRTEARLCALTALG